MEHTGLEASERTMRPVCQELRNERHELTFSYPWSEGETQKSGTWPSLFRTCSLPGPPSVGPRDPRGSSGSDAACPETAPRPAIPVLRQSAPLCFRFQCALGRHGPHAVPPLLPHAAVTAVRAPALHRAHGADRCHVPGLALAAGRRAPAQGPGHIAVC